MRGQPVKWVPLQKGEGIIKHLSCILIATVLGTVLLSFGAPVSQAAGASIIVTSLLDADYGADGFCTLREAIKAANNGATYNECTRSGSGADAITFTVDGTIRLGATLPAIADTNGLTIDGTGHTVTISGDTTGDGTGDVRIMVLDSGRTLTLQNLTITKGKIGSNQSGGGVFSSGNLNVIDSTFSDNQANPNGGAIYSAGGTVNIADSTFSANSSGSYTYGGNGGAIYMAGGTLLNIVSSTLNNNSSLSSGGISNSGMMTVTNSTFSGNSASEYGGGAIGNSGTLTVTNSTIYANNGRSGYGGGGIYNSGTATLKNTIVAKGAYGDCTLAGAGAITADSYNIDSDGSCGGATTWSLSDIIVASLVNNGGPTQTRALIVGSVAIDAGDDSVCSASPVNNLDQRGATRTQGAHCDVGAYEYGGAQDQTISFGALPNKSVVDPPFTVSATTDSGLPVTFSASGQCTVSGSTVSLSGFGTCSVTARQSGNSFYYAAADVSQSFSIVKANQTISFAALANKTYGDPSFAVSASASSGLAVTLEAFGQCSISGTLVTLAGAGSCTITARQAGNSNYNAAADASQSLTINKASQTITFNALSGKSYGDAPFTVSATASSGLAVTFSASGSCTVSGTTVTLTGGGSCTITAQQSGNANYNAAADVARTFSIGKVDQTISFAALSDKAVGAAPFTVSATASSGLAVTFSASGSCTVSGSMVTLTGSGICTITAHQAGDSNYNTAPDVARSFQISSPPDTGQKMYLPLVIR